MPPSAGHIQEAPRPAGSIPQPVKQSHALSPPKPAAKVETYSVSVHKVPVQSLLFALARDAKLNVDIHPGIEGNVTLNALDQTLPQLLTRIAKQVDMRYELDGPNLVVLPDTPFLRNYRIDYVNIARNTTSNVSIATQISTAGSGGDSAGNNNSTTSVTNTSNNRFWETLAQNIQDTLRETDKVIPENDAPAAAAAPSTPTLAANLASAAGATGTAPAAAAPSATNPTTPRRSQYREAASVIVNPETGLIAVRATGRQHEKIQEFLDMVMSSAKRQVLIEATVIEVQLNNQYQQGINWTSLSRRADATTSVTQAPLGGGLPSGVTPGTTPGAFFFNYANTTSRIGNIAATIQLLESFGRVKVLSSPKISVLNNQTALLKVVDNRVYFTITATTTPPQDGIAPITTYTSELHTVPVGFVMSVTPQIAESDEVTLNVRPSISRIIAFEQDPNPALANAIVPVVSRVPVIQTREMESVLKVASGQVAVMGGLMQDTTNNLRDGIPGINQVPGVGDALSFRNETTNKTELVIFMRPVVVKEASLSGDYSSFRDFLPDGNATANVNTYGAAPSAPASKKAADQ